MILEQHYLACLSQASYLIADESTRVAVIVDPRRDIELYLQRAEALQLVIGHVILTHFHADFVPGHLELAARTGAIIHLGARAAAQFPHRKFLEHQPLTIGNLRLSALETPGHTPESICVVVYDLAQDPNLPQAVLTGDTLFIGDVGRPDLLASQGMSAEQLASDLYQSLHEKLLKLPDSTLVYPGHGAGSACGKSLSSETVSTIGAQRRANPLLQPLSRADFVREATQGLGSAPAYFRYDAELNKQERAVLDDLLPLALTPLSVADFLNAQAQGALVIDTREPDEFAPLHLAGSINLGLSGKFATWAGTLLDPLQPLILICAPGKERESVTRLARIGFDRVQGVLQGGIEALRSHPERLRRFERIDPREFAPRSLPLLDVRALSERDALRIPGSMSLPLPELQARIQALKLDPKQPLGVHCAGGYRSTIACSLLERLGFERLVDMRGGMSAWSAAAQPCERGAAGSAS